MTRREQILDELAQFADEVPSDRQSVASLLAGANETMQWQAFWQARPDRDSDSHIIDDFGELIHHSTLRRQLET